MAKKKSVAKKSVAKKKQTKTVSPIPAGYHALTPYLAVRDAQKAIEFYKKAFDAKETGRIGMPDGKIGHADLTIGDSHIMLATEMPEWGNKGPETLGGTPVSICLYVKNVDVVFAKALKAGAKVERPVEDQFYGDRGGTLIDPFGHKWMIATHTEDMSFKEMQKRGDEMFKKKPA